MDRSSVVYERDTRSYTDFQKIILYLQYFIAQLDLNTKVTGTNVVSYLYKQ